jgi:hypothetical protein
MSAPVRWMRQIGVQVEFEILPDDEEPVCPSVSSSVRSGIETRRSRHLAFHLRDRTAHDRGHLGVRRIRAEQGSQVTDAGQQRVNCRSR